MSKENFSSSIKCLSSQRDLALEGLTVAAFDSFQFFLDEEGDACVALEIDECIDVLVLHSVAFEHLYRYFAGSKGIELTDDEWIVQLIRIEHFIECLECDSEDQMDEVA